MHFSIVICWKPCQCFLKKFYAVKMYTDFNVSGFDGDTGNIQLVYKRKTPDLLFTAWKSFGVSYIFFLEDYSVTCWKTLFTFILRIKWLICYSGRLYFEHRSAAYHEHVQRTIWSIERTSHSVRLRRRSWHIFFDPGPNYSALGRQISDGKS